MVPPLNLQRRILAADQPYHMVDELEANGCGSVASVRTVFLTAAECPIGCHMCDLWINTLPDKTPVGAIPAQLDSLPQLDTDTSVERWVKLYNSGNFFDSSSIPTSDYGAIASYCESFQRVIVENHPKIGRRLITRFRDQIKGKLEIAIGLETVQPRWLARMGKKMSRDDFDGYAHWLLNNDIDVRVFLIVGVPGASTTESIRWAKISIKHAIMANARHISLIPARAGNGWNGLGKLPPLNAEALLGMQYWAIDFAAGQSVITVDTWDMDEEGESDMIHQINLVNQLQRAP